MNWYRLLCSVCFCRFAEVTVEIVLDLFKGGLFAIWSKLKFKRSLMP